MLDIFLELLLTTKIDIEDSWYFVRQRKCHSWQECRALGIDQEVADSKVQALLRTFRKFVWRKASECYLCISIASNNFSRSLQVSVIMRSYSATWRMRNARILLEARNRLTRNCLKLAWLYVQMPWRHSILCVRRLKVFTIDSQRSSLRLKQNLWIPCLHLQTRRTTQQDPNLNLNMA